MFLPEKNLEIDHLKITARKDILVQESASIKEVLKKLDKTAEKVILVVDSEQRLLGTITDGDIRRYILSGRSLENDIGEIYNKKPIYIKRSEFSLERVKNILIENKTELLPILNEDGRVVNFTTWGDVFSDSKFSIPIENKINIPVVIMSGGRGVRLDPFTRILPKALIPIGDKPIIEIIIDEFKQWGVKDYYLTLNHKGEMIMSYLNSIEKDYNLRYVKEDNFFGTAGSLQLLENEISDIFIVSNCDIIVKADFGEVLNLHKEQKASLTILSSIRHYKIPYGVISFKEKGKLIDVLEKPEYTFTINTGVYILNKDILRFIPKETYFNMTDLIKNLIANDKKVIAYPVNESAYVDIGQWEEYTKHIDKLL